MKNKLDKNNSKSIKCLLLFLSVFFLYTSCANTADEYSRYNIPESASNANNNILRSTSRVGLEVLSGTARVKIELTENRRYGATTKTSFINIVTGARHDINLTNGDFVWLNLMSQDGNDVVISLFQNDQHTRDFRIRGDNMFGITFRISNE
ncbi:MAG: hypothetical protein FWD47_02690 [Treponema sp.]|nr:hypothetical protein [Treponema sp.]